MDSREFPRPSIPVLHAREGGGGPRMSVGTREGGYGQEGTFSLVSVDLPSLYVWPCIDGRGKYH